MTAWGQASRVVSTGTLIHEAIYNCRLLAFDYHGYPRVVQPFIFGVSGNRDMLSAVQVGGGGSGTQRLPGWKAFVVAEMENVRLLEDCFDLRRQEDYNPWDPHFTRVHAQVQ